MQYTLNISNIPDACVVPLKLVQCHTSIISQENWEKKMTGAETASCPPFRIVLSLLLPVREPPVFPGAVAIQLRDCACWPPLQLGVMSE